MYKRSKHMGQEFFDQGVNIALAPVASGPIGRSPLAGRNWVSVVAARNLRLTTALGRLLP